MTPILALLHWSRIGLRAGVVAGALVAWFWTQSLLARKSAAKEGIGDVVHDLTARWNRYFFTHDRAANAALIVSSTFIDLFGLSLIGAAIFGSTFAPFLAILILFGKHIIRIWVGARYVPNSYPVLVVMIIPFAFMLAQAFAPQGVRAASRIAGS